MRRITKLFTALAFLSVAPMVMGDRINGIITITSGTPIALTTVLPASSTAPFNANRIIIQALHGGTGLIQVCIVPVGTTPAANCSTAGQLGGEICPATSTAPGCNYTDVAYPDAGAPLEMRQYWVDGSHSGDTVLVSLDRRQ